MSILAFSTFRIFPFRGRIAWNRLSRACFAEPPAESPSTRKSSHLRLARRLPCPGGLEGLFHDLPCDGRGLLEEVDQFLVNQGVHDSLHFAVSQAMLCLPLELGLGDLDGYHGGQSFS